MAKIGDKFVIEIAETFKDGKGELLYQVKGFSSLVFDDYGIEKLTPYETPLLSAAVKKAYSEGVEDTVRKYEFYVERCSKEVRDLRENVAAKDSHIKALYAIIEKLRVQIDRKDLPYDAFGDYSNMSTGKTNVDGFTADEWYRENFRNDETDEIQEAED